jgi:Zn finger protein HypA/HybF involved in hydrogenase expression
MLCEEKHTKYQPTDEEWKCPKCGAGADDFTIDLFLESVGSDDCELLHERDPILCTSCEHCMTGKRFITGLLKKKNLVTCPHCKGTGLVNG